MVRMGGQVIRNPAGLEVVMSKVPSYQCDNFLQIGSIKMVDVTVIELTEDGRKNFKTNNNFLRIHEMHKGSRI
ncbi:hypothetical protein G9A89_017235 [Geosiphon pyriformis]|nr:hypothetical protein G9A89_017235 [Geosiphon pyriformis]